MAISGFSETDFSTFEIEGLKNRMEAIQTRIQPTFQTLGTELVDYLSGHLGNEVYLHIAKHARRTVNPPQDTLLAIADNKRGYKKHPHFQVGLFDDHLFIWLAFIYELDGKEKIAKEFIANFFQFEGLPKDFVISFDHMKKDHISIEDLKLKHLERFRDVKKAELLIGRHLSRGDQRVEDGETLVTIIKETFADLIPLYQQAMKVR